MGESKPQVITFSHSKRMGKKPLVITIFVVVILVLLAVIFYVLTRNTTPQLSASALTNQVNVYNTKKEYQKAINLINGQKDQNTTDQTLLASVYINSQQYGKALDVYAKISATGHMTQSIAENAATLAQTANNKQLAITYYQQAKKIAIANGSPVTGAYVEYYSQKIQSLEK